jgi:hypothetical protein
MNLQSIATKLTGNQWTWTFVATLATVFSCVGCQLSKRSSIETDSQVGVNYGVGPLVYDALAPGRVDASLVVSRSCATGFVVGKKAREFLPRNVQSTRSQALAYIISQYPTLSWKEDRKILRLTDSAARPGLLAVRIKELSVAEVRELRQISAALENSSEVQEFMKKDNAEFMHPISTLSGGALNLRPDGTVYTPYPPGTKPGNTYHFKDATVAEILDQIVITSPGMWAYEECDWKDGRKIGLSLHGY